MITPTTLQKIVDGELAPDMLAITLRQFDSEPTHWRSLALAMLEEQQWAKQIADMQAAKSGIASPSNSANANSANGGERPAMARLTAVQPLVSSASGFVERRQQPIWMGALAASLLIGIGFYSGAWLTGGKAPSNTLGLPSQAVATQPPRPLKSRSGINDGMKMVVTGPNAETAEIPIYDLEEIDHSELWAKEDLELARLKKELRRKGYQLEVQPEYFTSKLNDGRQLIVPVNNVNLKPFGL
jgi:hypothetical protein